MCKLIESEHALGYGIHGHFPVKSCMLDCKWNKFLVETMLEKLIAEPDVDGDTCKCNYAPRYWEGEGSKKHWFQYRVSKIHTCTKQECKRVFFDWGNMFLKKVHFSGDNERMDMSLLLESQGNYEMTCTPGMPEAIVLPPPSAKIVELQKQIANTDDEEEKARLQALLDELLGNKEVEVFQYDLEGEWSPTAHHASEHSGPDLHSFYLKPCKSNLGNEVTDLHDILEQCGPWEKGTSMKEGEVRYTYHTDKQWGEEILTYPSMGELDSSLPEEVKARMSQRIIDSAAGYELLSFRLKPCMTPSGEREVNDPHSALRDDRCGEPELGKSLLPVKVSVSKKYDPAAPADELDIKC